MTASMVSTAYDGHNDRDQKEGRTMKPFWISIVMGGALIVVTASPGFAFHCPALVKECQTTADIVAGRPGSDKTQVDAARKGCDEALKLHQEGKHKESMINAGDTIAALSKALK